MYDAGKEKALELKKQKDEMQIAAFEAGITDLWKKVDPEDTGYVGKSLV